MSEIGGQNSGRIPTTFHDWMTDHDKRAVQNDRRPVIQNAADLLGPGIAPYAVAVLDWNDDTTGFNGIFYSLPGAINGPDSALSWIGTSYATPDGFGLMSLRQYDYVGDTPGPEWQRRFFDPGTGERNYSAWTVANDPRFIGEAIMTFSDTPPSDRYLPADGRSLLRTDYPELFTVLGLVHGTPTDDAHFFIPDMRKRFPQGSHPEDDFNVGNTDNRAVEDRTTRHTHSIAANNGHTHGAGTLQTGLSSDRAAGALGRATQTITGNTANSGSHDHGGQTGTTAYEDFPHMIVAWYLRALP